MWMFETEEFRSWIEQRKGHEVKDLPASLRERCLACGTRLESIPYVRQATCGFCLAYEFGYDEHGERVADAITGIAKIVTGEDREAFKYLYRQLLEDVGAGL